MQLSLFTIPKAFDGFTTALQTNALRSWLQLDPQPQVILCGNDQGVAEAAESFGAVHLPHISTNSYGTPLLDSAFHEAQAAAVHATMLYVNADIILTSALMRAVEQIPFKRFLLCGQRIDVDTMPPLEFKNPAWEQAFTRQALQEGRLYEIGGMDYFVFRKGTMSELPAFAVGRPCWDNWMIYQARSQGLPVVDLTPVFKPIHQVHGYAHVSGQRGNRWEGIEGDFNLELAGGRTHLFTMHDCTHQLTEQGLKRLTGEPHLGLRVHRQSVLAKDFQRFSWLRQKLFWIIQVRLRFLPERLWRYLVYSLAY